MARTTPSDVKLIIDVTSLNDSDDEIVQAYIDDANVTVTEIIGSDTTLSDSQKASIEKYLTAHLLASTRLKQAKEETVREASIKYQGTTGMGLKSTFYGQQVLLLDTTGKFAQNVGKKRVTIEAVTSFD